MDVRLQNGMQSNTTGVFDYIPFSKFHTHTHTHNGDDTIPGYTVLVWHSGLHFHNSFVKILKIFQSLQGWKVTNTQTDSPRFIHCCRNKGQAKHYGMLAFWPNTKPHFHSILTYGPSVRFNHLALELDIYSLTHHLCKMWIFYEPRRVTLGNTRHFVEE